MAHFAHIPLCPLLPYVGLLLAEIIIIENKIAGNGEHFAPVYPFRIVSIKVPGPPSRFVAKMFIFLLVPQKQTIMSKV